MRQIIYHEGQRVVLVALCFPGTRDYPNEEHPEERGVITRISKIPEGRTDRMYWVQVDPEYRMEADDGLREVSADQLMPEESA